jgi:hypothetical protein
VFRKSAIGTSLPWLGQNEAKLWYVRRPSSTASAWATPAAIPAHSSSVAHWNPHSSGDSTTPSSDMNRPAVTLRIVPSSVRFGRPRGRLS